MTWKILLQNSLIFLNFSFEKLNIKALFLLTIKISISLFEKNMCMVKDSIATIT